METLQSVRWKKEEQTLYLDYQDILLVLYKAKAKGNNCTLDEIIKWLENMPCLKPRTKVI